MRTLGQFRIGYLFTPSGRIDRLTYFLSSALLVILTYLLTAGLSIISLMFQGMLSDSPPAANLLVGGLLPLIVSAPLFYGTFCVSAQRLHDFGMPAIFALVAFTNVAFVLAQLALESFTPEQLTVAEVTFASLEAISIYIPLGFGILLLLIPGTRGENRYGKRLTDAPARPQMLDG